MKNNKKMPSVDDIRKEIVFEDILEYMEIYGVVNSEGKYLSYDELKYRLQPGDDLKTAWVATKFSRSCIMKNISIDCKNEKPFTFCVPDSLQAILHEIDMNISRGINNESSMINDDYKKYFISSLFEESISSAQLEGASTTRKVAKEMLEKERAPLNKSEKMAVNNYYLMTKVKEYSDKELSKEMILELHEIAVEGAVENEAEPGRFRDSDDIFV
ncbi:MAG: cell filamentation protein Fic, partial [Candidatus Cloacimonetes bacterium]|nr:cell filamentation protein Fic [Candidatus Cloacimonadota bacterium]